MINFGPLTVYPQSLALLVAIVVSSYAFWREGVKKKFEEEPLLDFVLVVLVGGILGGRFFYFLFEQNLTAQNFLQVLKFWQGGGTLWHGALVGGAIAGTVFAHYNFWDLKKISDVVVPALLLGQAIGSIPLYPVEALFFLILFLLFNHIRKGEFAYGFRAASYLIFGSLLRFVAEFFRLEKTFFLGINLNQVLSVLFLILGVVGLGWVYRDSKRNLKMDIKGLTSKVKLPRIPLDRVIKQLRREEKKLGEQQERLTKDDPLLEPERTLSNSEMGDEALEEISHRHFAVIGEAVKNRSAQVQKALLRLKKGKYGLCADCGQSIDPARLKVDPSVILCLQCQEKKEILG